jgi:hypothetical protein
VKKQIFFTLVVGALVSGLALFSAGSRGEEPRRKGASGSANTDSSPTNDPVTRKS